MSVLKYNDFMNKDVSELIIDNLYLFHTTGNKTYLYKNGRVGVGYIDEHLTECFYSVPYTKGTLQDYISNLGDTK